MIQFPVHFGAAFNDEGWEPHPFVVGLQRKTLFSRDKDGSDVTVFLFRGGGGKIEDVPFHAHATADEYTYVFAGTGKFEIEGQGIFEIQPGSMMCVPRGMRHRALDNSETLLTMNIYSPAIE